MYTTNIANISIDAFVNINEAVESILTHGKGKIAVAINPEKILLSIKSPEIHSVIVNSDIRYLDGIGAVFLARKRLNKDISRIPGCELWEGLMKASASRKVFLLGSKQSIVKKTKEKLECEYGVNICGYNDGFFQNDEEMITILLQAKPDILTVAMGSPRQEIFMQKCKQAGLNAFMMGVGGTFNVYVGEVERAPASWCNLNLEWLFRLLKEPSRLGRQLKLFEFLWLAFRNKI